jgi:hypothetical protein
MAASEWKRMWSEFLDGVEKELRSAAPAKTKLILDTFRQRFDRDSVPRRRKRFQRDLEAALERNPLLRAATRRYFFKRMQSALKAAAEAQNKAERLLQQLENKKKHFVN